MKKEKEEEATGIIAGDGNIQSQPAEMLAALKAEWQPILTAQSPDPPQYLRGLDYVGGLEP